MSPWFLIPALLVGFALGFWLAHKPAKQEIPTMSEEEKRALRDFQKFLSYDGFN
ncbi:MAG: AtpZ/AtpI family protein [Clostridia bacterium]|nr:AtpZ/AtpI family protein [Clostridia bacterium]